MAQHSLLLGTVMASFSTPRFSDHRLTLEFFTWPRVPKSPLTKIHLCDVGMPMEGCELLAPECEFDC